MWSVTASLPPGTGHGSWRALTAAVLTADAFPVVLAAWASTAALLLYGVGRLAPMVGAAPAAHSRRAVMPLLWGASLPTLSLFLDPYWFWPTAAPLAAVGAGLGLLAAARGMSRSGVVGTGVADGVIRSAVSAAALGLPLLLLVTGWSPPSGDEPHYLIVAHSVVFDGDLDLADDYADRVYAPFHPAALSPHYRPGLREGSRYSMHGIGLPLLLAPAYALGRAWDPSDGAAMVAVPRLVLVLLYGVFAWTLYGFVAEVASARAASRGTAATVLAAPLLFAPLALFAEVPAMLLSLLVFRAVRRPTGGSLAHGAALALLPFVGVKYLPLAAALFLVGSVMASPEERAGRMVRLGLPLAVGLALHGLFTWRLYGSLSPASIYLGVDDLGSAPALGGDWLAYVAAWPGGVATLIGYFLDQKEGLLAYGPHYVLTIAGLSALLPQRRRTLLALSVVAAAYLGPYALSQQLSGQSPPVRPLMAVLWMLAPGLGVALAHPLAGAASILRGGLLGLAAALTTAYASQPELLPHDYPVVASRLLQQYSPYDAGWWRAFPQWVNVDFPNPAVTAVWTIGVVAVAVALWRLGRGWRASGDPPLAADPVASSRPSASLVTAVGAFVAAGALVLLHHGTVVRTDRHRPTPLDNGLVAWLPERLPPVGFAESGGVWATPGRPVEFLLTAPGPLDEVAVSLRVLVPGAVAAAVQGATTDGEAAPGAQHRARLRPARGVADDGGYTYHVRVSADAGAAPADVEGGEDERFLGVLLQLTPLQR